MERSLGCVSNVWLIVVGGALRTPPTTINHTSRTAPISSLTEPLALINPGFTSKGFTLEHVPALLPLREVLIHKGFEAIAMMPFQKMH